MIPRPPTASPPAKLFPTRRSAELAKKGQHQVSQLQLAVTVSESIKLSLSNLKVREELRAEAIHDPLTGLFNRRYLEETLPRELHRARRADRKSTRLNSSP